jgi:two-component system chemotaxis sensor kinase CheA
MSSHSSSRLSQQSIREFLLETQESLGQIEAELINLDQSEEARKHPETSSGRMFRLLHSIKGTCSFLGYPKVEELAHVGENLLGRVRDGLLSFDATVVNALLAIVDAIREVIDHIESEQTEGNSDYTYLTRQLTQIVSQADPSESLLVEAAIVQHPQAAPVKSAAEEADDRDRANIGDEDGVTQPRNDILDVPTAPAKAIGVPSAIDRGRSLGSVSQGLTIGRHHTNEHPVRGVEPRVADSYLRVDVGLLDQMMTLAGELVQTRNHFLRDGANQVNGPSQGKMRQLNSITSELQACIMQSRMQPIATIWNQIPRMVRDIALGSFKKVRLEMEGSETELDKAIIESVRDPLNHILRNSVDHGIELPELRAALGKPTEGRIWVRAYHAGGQVNIEIEDDGAGIDPQIVRRIAMDKKIVTQARLEQLNDAAAFGLIFEPGFSTASRVTKLSGRGVGLDVVKTNIEKLGGTIHVQSRIGLGTTFTLRIPLTLAIVQALIVCCADEAYAIPQSRVAELVRLRGDEALAMMHNPGGIPNYRFRGKLLPIVSLRKALDLNEPTPGAKRESNLVVLRVHDRQFGLVVDRIVDTQEVVIKPMWHPLRNIHIYAGATQLADGRIALILDPIGIAKRVKLISELRETVPKIVDRSEPTRTAESILVGQLSTGERIALPMCHLKRIEKLDPLSCRKLNGQELYGYKDEIIPVVDLTLLWGQCGTEATDSHFVPSTNQPCDFEFVAIYETDGMAVGIKIGTKIDVIQHVHTTRGKPLRAFVEFTTLIHGQLTEVIDVSRVVAKTISPPAGSRIHTSRGHTGD